MTPYVKQQIDRSPGRFRFFISGSQSFALMKGISESLAGRAAILDLWPTVERIHDRVWNIPLGLLLRPGHD